jgi:hypothetical protein
MENIVLQYLGIVLAAIALWVAIVAKTRLAAILNFEYLEGVVLDAIEGWRWRKVEDGIDVTDFLAELNSREFTVDVITIAWRYTDGDFESRMQEATEDLLDALLAPGE